MKCPDCKSPAITFIAWCQGIKAFKTECKSCGINLKSNLTTNLIFILTMLISLSFIPYLDEIFSLLEVEMTNEKFQILIILPIVFIGGAIAWFSGGYNVNKKA